MGWDETNHPSRPAQQPRRIHDLEETRNFLRSIAGVCLEGADSADPRVTILAALVVKRQGAGVNL